MDQPTTGTGRRLIVAGACAVLATWVGQPAAHGAESGSIPTLVGRADGYHSNVSLSGGRSSARGPAGTTGCDAWSTTACSPSAALPPTGGIKATTDRDGAMARHGSAVVFTSSSSAVRTSGTTDRGGAVSSSARSSGVGGGPFSAAAISSTCTASGSGAKASTAVADGRLVTRTNPGTGAADAAVPVDPAPRPGTTYTGTVDHAGYSFRAVLNEQIPNPDGSITVNALHLSLLGPAVVGEVVVGRSVCGVTSTKGSQALSSSRVAAATTPAMVESSSRSARTASLAAAPQAVALPTQTAAPAGPGAFGYVAEVSLFGGPQAIRPCANPPTNTTDCRPRPAVSLPSGGSPTPVTESVATADARFGPGIVFTSGPIGVSTEGTAASTTSKVEIRNVNASGQEVFTASGLSSTCTGGSGSTTITGGTLRTSEGDPDNEGDDTDVPIPANPPPNTTREGKIEGAGDTYRAVFNEQIVKDGSLTVNAYHLFLLGPTAKGELVVGQSRCGGAAASRPATGTPGTGTPGSASAGGTGSAGPSSMATTGFAAIGPLLLGLILLALGSAACLGGARLRLAAATRPADDGPSMA